MWRDPRTESNKFTPVPCPKCKKLHDNLDLEIPSMEKCKICYIHQRAFKCERCKSVILYCWNCKRQSSPEKKESPSVNTNQNSDSNLTLIYTLVSVVVVIAGVIICKKFAGSSENELVANVKKLKEDYPSQKNETWYHILGVLENEIPAVKSITFLHGKDTKTSDCLTNELVFLFTRDKNIKSEDITFADFKALDYGFLLEHYHSVVKRFKVFITDLNKVSGNAARIFQSLCDDVSSDIKPSLFIFTLKYSEKTKSLKPIERATAVLRKTWSDLPENELYPLLSRVVKNVVDIIPESKLSC